MRSSPSRAVLLLVWLWANIIGWLLATAVLYAAGELLINGDSRLPEMFYNVAFVLAGAIMGLLQWQALKSRYLLSGFEWVGATAAGFGLGLAGMAWSNLLDLYANPGPPGTPYFEWDSLIGALLVGVAVGVCQMLVWRRSPGRALTWLLAAGLGWAAGLFLADLGAFLLFDGQSGTGSLLLHLVVAPVVATLVSGLALSRQPVRPLVGSPTPATNR